VLRWSPTSAMGFYSKEGQDQSAEKRLGGGAHQRGAKVAAAFPIPLALAYLRRLASDKKQKGKEGGEVVLVEHIENKKEERGSVGVAGGHFNGCGAG
jgi:hypothetical protein